MQLLRLATAGSVDDGKSTLIGRLLHDTKSLHEDTFDAVERTSRARGDDYTDLALVTDGLRAEREQGITIDVAYRYFSTPRRSFVIADTPGHLQYTRNMVTGASTADVAVVLVDVRAGLVEQSRRHAFLASLLGVPHLVLCVNKMDLVDYDPEAFERVRTEFDDFAARLTTTDVTAVPISALHGDNVVSRSAAMPWYEGASLLHYLEQVHIAADANFIDVRFPVQYVIRPQRTGNDYRGYAGQVAGGVLRPGDEVMVLPSGLRTTVAGIDTADGEVTEAFPPMSVVVRLADDLDVSRGDMICRPANLPSVTQDLDATLCWMGDDELRVGGRYGIKHTTRVGRAVVRELRYRLDVTALHRDVSATTLVRNDIGRVSLRVTTPLFVDAYRRNRATGGFILIDEPTGATVAAGMVLDNG